MNRIAAAGALALCLIAPEARAARLGVAKVGDAWALFVRGDQSNEQFDSLGVSFATTSPYALTNITSGLNQRTPCAPGEQFTFINRRLDQDILDGGLGWSILGRSVTATGLTFGGGPLGGTIDTSTGPQGWLFLANFMFSPPANNPPDRPFGTIRVQLLRAGNIVADLNPTLADDIIIPLPVPEPATSVLSCASLLGLAGLRRVGLERRISFH